MCGIVGYNGNQQAAPILLKGLEKLEYRGYDCLFVMELQILKLSKPRED